MFKIYSKSFNKQSETSLKTLAKTEVNIKYNNLSYKIFLLDGTFHEISFLKKYGSLYSLLENLVNRKTDVNNANADQISFIINQMHGYKDQDLFDKKTMGIEFFHNTILTKQKKLFQIPEIVQKRNKELPSNKF